jgi:filamentous hemagglutinin family protein
MKPYPTLLLAAIAGMFAVHSPALAQSIRAAQDGTGTQVDRNGQRYTITGGAASRDRRNLFHSFEQLGLNEGEIATFLSNPDIQNILARVTGGEASLINGLLQIRGGNSNLFLMNPAGIIFGANARLDLPAAFTATTATGIGLEGGWFRAIGENDYATLVGTPSTFAFALGQPGTILNAGNLSVLEGQSINFLGGTVVNTGQLTAPSGQITLTAVPGQSRVRLSQAGSPLSIEINADEARASFSPLLLPQLLTGGDIQNATGLMIALDGTIQISNAVIPASPNTTTVSGTLDTTSPTGMGTIAVLGDRVNLLGARLVAPGGSVLVGGDYQGRGTLPQARFTFMDSGSAIEVSGLSSVNGGQAILWSTEGTAFNGVINARGGNGGGNGGLVEVSSLGLLRLGGRIDASAPDGMGGTVLFDPVDLLIRSGLKDGDDADTNPFTFAGAGETGQLLAADTLPSVIYESELENILGQDIILQATRNITIEPLFARSLYLLGGRNITFTADADNDGVGNFSMEVTDTINTLAGDITITGANITAGNITTTGFNAGSITLSTRNPTTGLLRGDITVTSLEAGGFLGLGTGGNVELTGDRVQVTGFIPLGRTSINTRGFTSSGTIDITHAGGADNLPFTVGSASSNGTLGAIASGAVVPNRVFSMAPNGDRVTQGNLIVTSENATPTLAINASFSTQQNQPITINYSDLFPNSNSLNDGDRDNFKVQIASIPTGATLTRGGSPLSVGSILAPGDVLTYTPVTDATGLQSAFEVKASDLDNGTAELSSAIVPVQININPTIVPPPVPVPPPAPRPRPVPPPVNNTPPAPSAPILTSTSREVNGNFSLVEQRFTRQFQDYLGVATPQFQSLSSARKIAREIESATSCKPAFLYLSFAPTATLLSDTVPPPQDDDQLELLMVTAEGVTRKRISAVTRSRTMATVERFRGEVTDVRRVRSTSYLASSQQLYKWLIAPVLEELQSQEICNLVFLPEAGLRSLPFAALHSGESFLIEQFSLGLMPSLSLADTEYRDLKGAQVLAMGISESTQGQAPLPAVPVELNSLALSLWKGEVFLNGESTIANLRQGRSRFPYGIVHLATHADFVGGNVSDSYIQLWEEKLRLSDIRAFGWNDPPIEMLVLSACRTALGNNEAEMGLAGLVIQTGVRTVVASLWYVNDISSAALMTGFYQALNTSGVKADALRQAQIGMLKGNVAVENGTLKGIAGVDGIAMPNQTISITADELSHPYYWAAFTMIGNPW